MQGSISPLQFSDSSLSASLKAIPPLTYTPGREGAIPSREPKYPSGSHQHYHFQQAHEKFLLTLPVLASVETEELRQLRQLVVLRKRLQSLRLPFLVESQPVPLSLQRQMPFIQSHHLYPALTAVLEESNLEKEEQQEYKSLLSKMVLVEKDYDACTLDEYAAQLGPVRNQSDFSNRMELFAEIAYAVLQVHDLGVALIKLDAQKILLPAHGAFSFTDEMHDIELDDTLPTEKADGIERFKLIIPSQARLAAKASECDFHFNSAVFQPPELVNRNNFMCQRHPVEDYFAFDRFALGAMLLLLLNGGNVDFFGVLPEEIRRDKMQWNSSDAFRFISEKWWEIYRNRKRPFITEDELSLTDINGVPISFFSTQAGRAAKDLILKLLSPDPEVRQAVDILAHPALETCRRQDGYRHFVRRTQATVRKLPEFAKKQARLTRLFANEEGANQVSLRATATYCRARLQQRAKPQYAQSIVEQKKLSRSALWQMLPLRKKLWYGSALVFGITALVVGAILVPPSLIITVPALVHTIATATAATGIVLAGAALGQQLSDMRAINEKAVALPARDIKASSSDDEEIKALEVAEDIEAIQSPTASIISAADTPQAAPDRLVAEVVVCDYDQEEVKDDGDDDFTPLLGAA